MIVQPAVAGEAHAHVERISTGFHPEGAVQELVRPRLPVGAVLEEPREARHQRARDSSRFEGAIHVAQDVGLLRVKEMLERVLGEHTLHEARELRRPEVEEVPRHDARIVRDEIEIDEAIEYPLAAAEMQPQRAGSRGHRIGSPTKERRKARVLHGDRVERERARQRVARHARERRGASV